MQAFYLAERRWYRSTRVVLARNLELCPLKPLDLAQLLYLCRLKFKGLQRIAMKFGIATGARKVTSV